MTFLGTPLFGKLPIKKKPPVIPEESVIMVEELPEVAKAININDGLKMSSFEIAELTGKRHDNVLRDCDNLNINYERLSLLKLEEGHYTHLTISAKVYHPFRSKVYHPFRSKVYQ